VGFLKRNRGTGFLDSLGETPEEHRIGQRLVAAGVITGDQLAMALEHQRREAMRTVDALVELGYIEPRQFMKFLAKQPGIPSISLRNYKITEELLDLVPRYFARKYEVFPIDRMGKLLTVAMVCPLDLKAIAVIEKMSGLKVKPMLSDADEIHAAIARYYLQIYGDEPVQEHRPPRR
jgi:type IV pilus assembly protein PilB